MYTTPYMTIGKVHALI